MAIPISSEDESEEIQNAIKFYQGLKEEALIDVENSKNRKIQKYHDAGLCSANTSTVNHFLILDTNIWMYLAKDDSQLRMRIDQIVAV